MLYTALNAITREATLRSDSAPRMQRAHVIVSANADWSLMALYAATIRLVRGETKIAARSPRAATLQLTPAGS